MQIVDLEPAAQIQPDEDGREVAVAALAKRGIGEEEAAAALRDAGDAASALVAPVVAEPELLLVVGERRSEFGDRDLGYGAGELVRHGRRLRPSVSRARRRAPTTGGSPNRAGRTRARRRGRTGRSP